MCHDWAVLFLRTSPFQCDSQQTYVRKNKTAESRRVTGFAARRQTIIIIIIIIIIITSLFYEGIAYTMYSEDIYVSIQCNLLSSAHPP